jgi:hypothetical protein
MPKIKHLMYVPFTGLGLYNGFRGNRWLKNRIAIFKRFVVPSLQAQTSQDFIIWISWRREERNNPHVLELKKWLKFCYPLKEVVFTFSGVCFYDDKYPDAQARSRLIESVHGAMPNLFDVIADCDCVYMTIQPSDDLYHRMSVEAIQKVLEGDKFDAVGFPQGYICNYNTKEVAEYNPNTNPPFYTIKFPKEVFTDPLSHVNYTALKRDSGKYKAGTPLPSHEYVPDCFRYALIGDLRGFLVGTHGENISTTFIHPFKGYNVPESTLKDFGIHDVPPLKLKISLRKKLLRRFPHSVQRKLRYWFGEKLWTTFYNFLRS